MPQGRLLNQKGQASLLPLDQWGKLRPREVFFLFFFFFSPSSNAAQADGASSDSSAQGRGGRRDGRGAGCQGGDQGHCFTVCHLLVSPRAGQETTAGHLALLVTKNVSMFREP